MYIIGDWVEGNEGNLSFGDWFSTPRKYNNSKPPTGKCSSPRTNNHSKPQRGETRRNPQEETSGNRKSKKQSELAPNGFNSKVPSGQFQRRSKLAPKRINSEAPEKAKRNPWEGISGNFHSQGRSKLAPKVNKLWGASRTISTKWRQKEIIPKCQREIFVPAGQLLRSVKFLCRSKLVTK